MSDVSVRGSQGATGRRGGASPAAAVLSVVAISATVSGAAGIAALAVTPLAERLTLGAWGLLWTQCLALIIGGALSALSALVAFVATLRRGLRVDASHGRPLRRGARRLVADVAASAPWSARVELRTDDTRFVALPSREIPEDLRPVLALAWREAARREHAAVASFAELSVDLIAVGAPPELVAAAHSDALDEVRHAQICFAVARELDGAALGPAPFADARAAARVAHRDRTAALVELARSAVRDGVVGEGLSARVLAKLAQRCALVGPRAALRQLASDESRHAAHAWRIVAWCLQEGGEPVRRALVDVSASLPERATPEIPTAMRDGACEVFGVHGEALERDEYVKVRDRARLKLAALTQSSAQAVAA
jgi:hypothetical protein